jgi:hypothetical protein
LEELEGLDETPEVRGRILRPQFTKHVKRLVELGVFPTKDEVISYEDGHKQVSRDVPLMTIKLDPGVDGGVFMHPNGELQICYIYEDGVLGDPRPVTDRDYAEWSTHIWGKISDAISEYDAKVRESS